MVRLSRTLADRLRAKPDDLVYVTDARWWLGGLRSAHTIVGSIDVKAKDEVIELGPEVFEIVVHRRRVGKQIIVERLY